jgi:hypothetical protein
MSFYLNYKYLNLCVVLFARLREQFCYLDVPFKTAKNHMCLLTDFSIHILLLQIFSVGTKPRKATGRLFITASSKFFALLYLNNATTEPNALEELMEAEGSDERPDGRRPQRCAQGHPNDHRMHQDPQLQDLHNINLC